MTLGQKLRQLRHLEGELRGLGRELTQSELVRAIRSELGADHQPVLSVADREGHAAAPVAGVAAAARAVLQGPSRISRQRPAGISHRAHLRRRVGRDRARPLARRRRHPVRPRSRARRRARARRHARGVAPLPGAARRNDLDAGAHRSTLTDARSGGAEMNWPAIFLGCFVDRLRAQRAVVRARRGRTRTCTSTCRGSHHVHGDVFHGRARARHRADQLRDDHRVCRLVRRRPVTC